MWERGCTEEGGGMVNALEKEGREMKGESGDLDRRVRLRKRVRGWSRCTKEGEKIYCRVIEVDERDG